MTELFSKRFEIWQKSHFFNVNPQSIWLTENKLNKHKYIQEHIYDQLLKIKTTWDWPTFSHLSPTRQAWLWRQCQLSFRHYNPVITSHVTPLPWQPGDTTLMTPSDPASRGISPEGSGAVVGHPQGSELVVVLWRHPLIAADDIARSTSCCLTSPCCCVQRSAGLVSKTQPYPYSVFIVINQVIWVVVRGSVSLTQVWGFQALTIVWSFVWAVDSSPLAPQS